MLLASVPLGIEDFAQFRGGAIRYVEENAVRALLVNSAEEYQWSSAGGHAGGAREKAPVLDGEF